MKKLNKIKDIKVIAYADDLAVLTGDTGDTEDREPRMVWG